MVPSGKLSLLSILIPSLPAGYAIANGTLRLLKVEPKDELSSAYTREEVAAFVEESRGEGLLEDDEYDRLAGALGFTEKTVEAVLLEPSSLTTVARGSTVGFRQPSEATSSWNWLSVLPVTARIASFRLIVPSAIWLPKSRSARALILSSTSVMLRT